MTPMRRRRSRVAAAVALAAGAALLLAGCGGGVSAGTATVDGSGASGGGAAASCPTPATGQTVIDATVNVAPPGTFDPAGDARTYRLWLPADYTGTEPLPLIVNYHGTGGDPQSIDSFSSDLSSKAGARGYIVAAPQALSGQATTARWVVPAFGTAPDDIAFTNAMLDQIAQTYCVDTARVFATGFSSGGAMSTWIACADRSRFTGVVPGGGVNLVDPSCQTGPIPMYAYHGTADDVAFYNGIDDQPTPPDPATAGQIPFFGSVEQVMDVWAGVNGCEVQRQDQNLAPDAILRTYPGCESDTRVLLAVGAGHTFPGGTTRLGQAETQLGGTITSVNMADLMLDWFDGLPPKAA
jgi:polyhydroxybutyrate depolymerase